LPFLTIGPKRLTQAGLEFHELPFIDLILLSHAHFDHIDTRTLSCGSILKVLDVEQIVAIFQHGKREYRVVSIKSGATGLRSAVADPSCSSVFAGRTGPVLAPSGTGLRNSHSSRTLPGYSSRGFCCSVEPSPLCLRKPTCGLFLLWHTPTSFAPPETRSSSVRPSERQTCCRSSWIIGEGSGARNCKK
jgi:hypothetical protein